MENNEKINGEIEASQESQKQENKPRRRRFVIGFLAVTFSLIGVISVMTHIVNFAVDIYENSKKEKFNEYNAFLLPLAAIDPEAFDDITSADMKELVEISVWSIISSDMDPEKYDYSSGELVIPAADVEQAFIKYFGTQVTVSHTTVSGYGYEFRYDEDENAYYIPLTTITPIFTPDVVSVDTKGGAVTVICGLINSNAWIQNSNTGDISRAEPDKYIRVTMRKYQNKQYISAVQFESAA